MDLNTLWFILIGILFTGYFFLEGFDYGVGMLMPFLGKSDAERRQIINSIGPVWDANEVWLLTAGGAIFAAFPHWYATMFSGFYLALVIMLFGLIIRGVAFEFRGRSDSPLWRTVWDWAIFLGSLLPALIWGVAIANLLIGVPIDAQMDYTGSFWGLLNPYAILGGVLFVFLFMLHGANFLALRLEGELRQRAKRAAFPLIWLVAVLAGVAFLLSSIFATDIFSKAETNAIPAGVLTALALVAGGWLIRQGREALAFASIGLSIILATVMVFMGLFPRLMISNLNPDWSLTISNASSSDYTLQIMSIVAAIFVPIVLLYQGWTYWIFRKRISPNQKTDH